MISFARHLFALLAVVATPSEAFELELRGVEFQIDMPTGTSTLESSVKSPGSDSMAVLRDTANALLHHSFIKVKIVGFTDSTECVGSFECEALSRRRATLVYQWLLLQGVPESRLIAVEAKGSSDPIDSNDLEEGRQRNRRVEVLATLDSRNTPRAR